MTTTRQRGTRRWLSTRHIGAASTMSAILCTIAACGDRDAPPPNAPPPPGPPPPGAYPPPAGPPCAPGPPTCAPDRRAVVTSCNGQLTLVQKCFGPGGCATSGNSLICDDSVADVGDPCRAEGGRGCTTDGSAMLGCQGGRQVIVSSCKGARRCTAREAIACDTSVADPGNPCEPEGKLACARDGKVLFRCQGGRLAPSQQCARMACMIGGNSVLCQ